ncbi:MAG: hypothetical protein ACXVFN_19030 [Solirubrobacteraceae bacterium]
MRTDPTDNGGLFVGRRPGTAPVRYRDTPERGTARRQRVDGAIATALLGLMVLVNLLFWGPFPALGLWIASQVQYHTGSVTVGITAGFAFLLAILFGGLALLKRMDAVWILIRRAAGHDQREGVIGKVFGTTAVIGGAAFAFWLIFIGGLGSMAMPGH